MTSRREKGQGVVEYALLVVLVAIVVILVLIVTGTSVSDVYCQVIRGLGSGSGSCSRYFVDDFSNLNAWTPVRGNWQNPNGQQVLTGSDATYATGGVGFRTWDNTKACFDNLSVDPLP